MIEPPTVLTPPTPDELRATFERLIIQDLLGPHSPEEEVDANIIDHYLLGKLAPKGTVIDPRPKDPVTDPEDGDADDPAIDRLADAQAAAVLPRTWRVVRSGPQTFRGSPPPRKSLQINIYSVLPVSFS